MPHIHYSHELFATYHVVAGNRYSVDYTFVLPVVAWEGCTYGPLVLTRNSSSICSASEYADRCEPDVRYLGLSTDSEVASEAYRPLIEANRERRGLSGQPTHLIDLGPTPGAAADSTRLL